MKNIWNKNKRKNFYIKNFFTLFIYTLSSIIFFYFHFFLLSLQRSGRSISFLESYHILPQCHGDPLFWTEKAGEKKLEIIFYAKAFMRTSFSTSIFSQKGEKFVW